MEVLARSVLVVTIFFIGYVALYQATMFMARAIYRHRRHKAVDQLARRKWGGR